MVYHGPTLSEAEQRTLKILRAICQTIFWGCILIALAIPYSLNETIIIALVFWGTAGLWGEIRIGGRLRGQRKHHAR